MDPLVYLITYLKILLIVLIFLFELYLISKLVAKLLLIALRNLVFCLVVNNNSCGNSSLLKFLIPNLNDAPSLDLTAFLNLFIYTFVNLQFILVYSTIYILFLFNIL